MADFAQPTNEEKFLRKKFSEFYSNPINPITVIKPDRREFGFGGWHKKIEFRHIAVKSEHELRAKLTNEAPLYISHSVAYYEFPEARPMVKKNWLSADLVFDLDAEAHTCGKFTCEKCMEGVKQDAIKLIEEFLFPDFGFSKDEISVNFSGSRGYHIHVRSETVSTLEREARREIADYVSGTGLAFDKFFQKEQVSSAGGRGIDKLIGPKPDEWGYQGKFARNFLERLGNDENFAKSISGRLKKGDEIERMKSGIMEGNWNRVHVVNREKKLREKFEEMKLTMAGRIDANVTADTSKLIRMADSIHGGSGFSAKSIAQISGLAGFSPMDDAAAFGSEPLKVKAAEEVPELSIRNSPFGPLEKGAVVELPMHSAIYLLCKKAAVLV